jgi:transcriptional regulator GlxA family with amidase domain
MYVPTMQDLGGSFERLYAALEEAIVMVPTKPRRAEARLWEVLWQLCERAPRISPGGRDPSETDRTNPVVLRAQEIIELRLGEPLRVAQLASLLNVSHNHLTRLFQENLGTTVAGYIRGRRVERARDLLMHSTVPVKAVAAQVGLPDLHQFNKTVRAVSGMSPRKHRGAGR